jgi:GR25 family glycosyltransferase involved in LPS biosynthesis
MMGEQAKEFGLDLKFIWDFDVEALVDEDRARCDQEVLPPRSISCVLKHIEAQKRLIASNNDICLVLEDDAILGHQFDVKIRDTLALAIELEGPWLIFLGGMDNTLDSRFFLDDRLKLIESPLTTAEAYLINRQGCLARMGWLSNNLICKPADHFLKYVDGELGIAHYRVSTPFVTQGSITGMFATSLDASRATKPAWYLASRYRWNRFRKQTVLSWMFRIHRRFFGRRT